MHSMRPHKPVSPTPWPEGTGPFRQLWLLKFDILISFEKHYLCVDTRDCCCQRCVTCDLVFVPVVQCSNKRKCRLSKDSVCRADSQRSKLSISKSRASKHDHCSIMRQRCHRQHDGRVAVLCRTLRWFRRKLLSSLISLYPQHKRHRATSTTTIYTISSIDLRFYFFSVC